MNTNTEAIRAEYERAQDPKTRGMSPAAIREAAARIGVAL